WRGVAPAPRLRPPPPGSCPRLEPFRLRRVAKPSPDLCGRAIRDCLKTSRTCADGLSSPSGPRMGMNEFSNGKFLQSSDLPRVNDAVNDPSPQLSWRISTPSY